jgi:hypothetical protein
MTPVTPFPDALRQAAEDHLAQARELEAQAARAGEGRSFSPRASDLLVAAAVERRLADIAAKAAAFWF